MFDRKGPPAFLVEWENPRTGEFLEHRGGVAWIKAPLPRRWHKCVAQSRGFWLDELHGPATVERCACGALNLGDGWIQRNCRVT